MYQLNSKHAELNFPEWCDPGVTPPETKIKPTPLGDLIDVIISQGYTKQLTRSFEDEGVVSDAYTRGSVTVEVISKSGVGGYRVGTIDGWRTPYMVHTQDTARKLAFAQRTVNVETKLKDIMVRKRVARWVIEKGLQAFGFYEHTTNAYKHPDSQATILLFPQETGFDFEYIPNDPNGRFGKTHRKFQNFIDLSTVLGTAPDYTGYRIKGYPPTPLTIMNIIATHITTLSKLLHPYATRDSCILTSTVYQYVLPLFGIPAHTQVVRVYVNNPKAVEYYEGLEQGRYTQEEAQAHRDAGALSVGIGWGDNPEELGTVSDDGELWRGHLVTYAYPHDGGSWMVDATLNQVNKHGFEVEPLVVNIENPSMLFSGFRLIDSQGNSIEYTPFPGETSYMDSPDFVDRLTTIKLSNLIAEMVMSLGDGIFEGGIKQIDRRNNGEHSPS